jgi:cytochrome o ubiquinol oxidase operon protein cyoD
MPSANEKGELKAQERREFLSYVWGLGLALALTIVPFAIVKWSAMTPLAVLAFIGVFALAQIVVHFRFFLHISSRQKREDLQLLIFSGLILSIMLAGTLWIMASLALRMGMT